MAFVCISTTSCGSDDDDVSVKVQLIGPWKTSMGSSNWKYIKLVTMAVDGNSWAGYDSASGKTYAFTRTSTD